MELDIRTLSAAIALLPLAAVGIGLGLIFSSWISAVSRNPSAAKSLFMIGMIAAGLTEAIALFALVVSLLILFS